MQLTNLRATSYLKIVSTQISNWVDKCYDRQINQIRTSLQHVIVTILSNKACLKN